MCAPCTILDINVRATSTTKEDKFVVHEEKLSSKCFQIFFETFFRGNFLLAWKHFCNTFLGMVSGDGVGWGIWNLNNILRTVFHRLKNKFFVMVTILRKHWRFLKTIIYLYSLLVKFVLLFQWLSSFKPRFKNQKWKLKNQHWTSWA